MHKPVSYLSSWRHTPFRKVARITTIIRISSWRHTPFRNWSHQ
ncbi:hypothetical protein J558_0351 [Acinetobacter baumannii 1106579]|nr:hypothetical protein ACINNAV82_2752 [Acinetobacter baumannii Naval-82]EXE20718.1 hypothetical protein J558_0351 [Acinetobacter baumannii 1106579]